MGFFICHRGCIYGVQSYKKQKKSDNNLQFVCMDCKTRARAVLVRYDRHFSICFIKLCRISKGESALVCDMCGQPKDGYICECGFMGRGEAHCGNCGKKKEFGQRRYIDT